MSLVDMLGSKIFTFGPKSGTAGAGAGFDAAAALPEAASAAARTATARSKRGTTATFPISPKPNLQQATPTRLASGLARLSSARTPRQWRGVALVVRAVGAILASAASPSFVHRL